MKRNFKALAYPYIVWMGIFIIIPIGLIFIYSFTKGDIYTYDLQFTVDNYKKFFNPIYLNVLSRSLYLALVSTIICLVLGYPIAMIISYEKPKIRNIMLLFFLVPMWMNFLLRTYAWMTLLGKNGLINKALNLIGLPELDLLYNNGAVILGMVYNFLPFMVLPIYTVLSKLDKSVIEAAQDLGANKIKVFLKVTLPLSIPGIISGITMVFMPAVSTFVISRLLGGGQYMLIGNLIEQQFLVQGDWHFGSTLSIIMMIIILVSMAIMSRYENKQEVQN